MIVARHLCAGWALRAAGEGASANKKQLLFVIDFSRPTRQSTALLYHICDIIFRSEINPRGEWQSRRASRREAVRLSCTRYSVESARHFRVFR